MNNFLEKCKNTKLLAIIGVAGLILGTMMDYIKISVFGFTESLSLWGYWEGKIVLLLAIANTLFIFKDWVEKYIPALFNTNIGKKIANITNPKASLVPTILSVIFMFYLHNRLDIDSEYTSYGLGFYLLWIGAISLVAYAILYKKDNNVSNDPIQNNEVQSNEVQNDETQV